MLGERLRVPVGSELSEQLRGTLDVGEEERDRSGVNARTRSFYASAPAREKPPNETAGTRAYVAASFTTEVRPATPRHFATDCCKVIFEQGSF